MPVISGWYVVKCRWGLRADDSDPVPVAWHFEGRSPIYAHGPINAEAVAQELYQQVGAGLIFDERDDTVHQLALVRVEVRTRGTVQRLMTYCADAILFPQYQSIADPAQLAQLLTVTDLDQTPMEAVICLHLTRR